MRIPLATTLGLALLATPALAQSRLRASLDGAQEVPPIATTASGWATFVINPDNSVTYHMEVIGVAGIAAHIHYGAAGVGGGILVGLNGGPTIWSGTTPVLLAADIDLIQSGETYANVHSAAHGGGEVRGQILPSPSRFAGIAEGSQVMPPTTSSATGIVNFEVHLDRSVTYELTTTGLSGLNTDVHFGAFGQNAQGVLFTMVGGPTVWSGTSLPITADEYTTLQDSGNNVIVHTAAFLTGEIRGQLFPLSEGYGFGTPWSGGSATLSSVGAPMQGRKIDVLVSGGVPGGNGVLAVAAQPAAATHLGANLLIQPPTLAQIPMALDAAGSARDSGTLPAAATLLPLYLQFWGGGGPGVYNSNGLLIEVQPF